MRSMFSEADTIALKFPHMMDAQGLDREDYQSILRFAVWGIKHKGYGYMKKVLTNKAIKLMGVRDRYPEIQGLDPDRLLDPGLEDRLLARYEIRKIYFRLQPKHRRLLKLFLDSGCDYPTAYADYERAISYSAFKRKIQRVLELSREVLPRN